MRHKTWLIVIPATVLILFGARYLTSRSRGGRTATAFTSVKVMRGRLSATVDAAGPVTPIRTIDLTPSSAGRIIALPVQTGDRVRAGQTLARLDAAEARSRLRSTEDALNVAEKNLQTAEKNAILSPVQALSQVAEAKAALSAAGDTLSAAKSGATTAAKDVPAAETSLTQAKLNLAIAAVNAAGSGINGELASAQAAVRDARDALASARKDAAEMVLTAPIDGVVTEVNGRVGAATPDQTSLISVADISRLLVETAVNENDIAQVKPGQSARITLDALPGEEFRGKVIIVGEVGGAENDVVTFPVKVALEDPAHLVKAGMTADVSIITADRREALTVPNAALETRMGRTAVRMLAPDGRIVMRPVRTGLRTEMMTEITAGLSAGDRVAVPAPKTAGDTQSAGTAFGLGTGMRGLNGPAGQGYGNQGKGGATR